MSQIYKTYRPSVAIIAREHMFAGAINMKLTLLIILILAGMTTFITAQDPNQAELKKTEMKKLDKMIGQWQGSGWIQQGPKRETFSGTENVQRKIDGLALLIEGRFTNPEGKVIHETLAAMSYDVGAKFYKMRAYLASGMSGECDLKIVGDVYEWGFQTPVGATIKYTITVTPDKWTESGEFSKDGKEWMKFFEMKLDRVK